MSSANLKTDLPDDKESSFIKNPILIAILFLVISLVFRIIDIFVLELDKTPFNIVISKVVPLLLMLLYVGIIYKSFSPLGIHRKSLLRNLFLGFAAFLLFYGIDLLTNFLIASLLNYRPRIRISSINLLYLFYFLFFLIVNSFMEEGLFRGIMMRSFMIKTSKRTSNLLQALLFGLWHLVWPIKSALNGDSSLFFISMYALNYVFFSCLFGFLAGYLFQRSSSLINCVVFHTLWNLFVTYLSLIYSIDLTIQEAIISYIFETISLSISFTLTLILLYYILKKFEMPDLNSRTQPLIKSSLDPI